MASTYPTTLDGTSRFPTDVTDDTDSKAGTPRTGLKGFLAQWVDDVSDALVKVETELGTLPKGSYASVKARLDTLLSRTNVKAASTANIALPPGGTSLVVDGVTLVENDRILLKDQTLPEQNGIYYAFGIGVSVQLNRTVDADIDVELADVSVRVEQGTINGESQWQNATSLPLTVGTTALRFSRVYPSYPPYLRDSWQVGATPPLAANMDRPLAVASTAQTAITALTSFHGGMMLRAGTTYTNINSFCTATGSGAVTLNHYGLVRQADRASLRSTANSTALPGLGVYTRALSSPLVVNVDTPVWVQWSTQVATTSPSFAGQAALTALVQPLAVTTPIYLGNSTTTPTATPPPDLTVLGAPTTATGPLVYFWLT